MAIFEGADLDLPILTHIYQVDADNNDELFHLVNVAFYHMNRAGEGDSNSWPIWEKNRQHDFEGEFPRLREMCLLAQDVLSNLTDHREVTDEQQRKLIEYTDATDDQFAVPSFLQKRIPASQMLAPFRFDYPTDYVWQQFSRELKDALYFAPPASLESRDFFERCPECSGVFLSSPRRVYCSSRCRNRAGVKRFRAKQAV